MTRKVLTLWAMSFLLFLCEATDHFFQYLHPCPDAGYFTTNGLTRSRVLQPG